MTSLKAKLVQRILADGPIPFEEFMAAALYDPEGGFFTSKSLRSVKSGDFLTSPEVSPLFGETLARFVDHNRNGPYARFVLREITGQHFKTGAAVKAWWKAHYGK